MPPPHQDEPETTLALMRAHIDALPQNLTLPNPPTPISRTLSIRAPGSKSLTNRALLLAALARGDSILTNALIDADDAQVMLAAIQSLGAKVRHNATTLNITGVAGKWNIPSTGTTLNLHNAGTATRFLAASVLCNPKNTPLTIDGDPRMRERPINELIEALTAVGCTATFSHKPGYPPVTLTPPSTLPANGLALTLPRTQSGQFISAILLVAPFLPVPTTLRLTLPITSESYVRMTLGLLSQLGAHVQTSADLSIIRVTPGSLDHPDALPNAFTLDIEPDASSATYFAAAAALLPGLTVRLEGLSDLSLQGDAEFPKVLSRMGVAIAKDTNPNSEAIIVGSPDTSLQLSPILADLSDMPDAAMTLAAVAAFASGTSIIRGLHTLRVKESDRIEALKAQFHKIGVEIKDNIQGDPGVITITSPTSGVDCSPNCPPVTFDTYNDHRIAMSLALIALRRPNITINNPTCVRKTYPTYWQELANLWPS
ncbi:MAG: 3-phosphoshikimate 1-carboxyvinyltransferase [Phycisphaerales bacterium]